VLPGWIGLRCFSPASSTTAVTGQVELQEGSGQLGHANLGITSIYLQGIDSSEIIDTVHSRPAPVISALGLVADPRILHAAEICSARALEGSS
jgi:hypothetical protein